MERKRRKKELNYDLPTESENYVHRVGRTGRAKNKGQAYSFCAPEEQEILDEIQGFIHKEIKVLTVDLDDYDDTLHVDLERKNDYKSLMKEIEEFEEGRGKKKKKKRK